MTDDRWPRTKPWWQRRRWIAAATVFALLLAVGIVLVLRSPDDSCAPGVRMAGPDRQCVGITDGSYHFSDDLAGVSELIRAENAKIIGSDFVSVVYLTPLLPSADGTATADSIRHEIEGAYLAQQQADETNTYGDAPKIRLLLANSGTSADQRTAALAEIRSRIVPDRIIAVAGLGTSTDAAVKMIGGVTGDTAQGGLQLGAVASALTADTLGAVNGLVRTAPTNTDEAAAAASFLSKPPYAALKVMIVEDVRADDQYTKTLASAFLKALPKGRRVGQIEQYDSSQQGVATAFATRMATLCAARPDVVYFAGRGVDLAPFLAPLRTRSCAERPLIVLSGDDASQAAQAQGFNEIKDTLKSAKVRLIYTGLAHPGAWTAHGVSYPPAAVSAFRDAHGPFASAFPVETLDDGQAIMGFDAVLTTVVGARLASQSPGINGRVTGSEMIQIWKSLHSVQAVPGASGYISFDEVGSPTDKAVPIVEITATGAVVTLTVSAASGTPFVPPDPG